MPYNLIFRICEKKFDVKIIISLSMAQITIPKNTLSSFEELHNRIIADAETTTGNYQVKLDNKIMLTDVKSYVDQLISGMIPLDEVMGQSYIHKNGFQKIVLGRCRGFALRFHRYIPGVGDKNIHDHRWSRMDSFVLEGNLIADYLYHSDNKINPSIKFQHHTYTKVGQDYIVKHEGETYLRVYKQTSHPTGCLYSMTSKQLHRILPSDNPVGTLVVTHPVPQDRVWCNLYQKYVIEELEPVHEERLTHEQMMISLRHLSYLLSQHIDRKHREALKEGC